MDESQVSKCKECGARLIIINGHTNKKFCSDRCRAKYWKEHRSEVGRKTYREFICPVCGKKAKVYGKPGQKYCSFKCYLKVRYGGKAHD